MPLTREQTPSAPSVERMSECGSAFSATSCTQWQQHQAYCLLVWTYCSYYTSKPLKRYKLDYRTSPPSFCPVSESAVTDKSALVSVLFFNNCLFLTHTERQLEDHTLWSHWKHFQSASYRPDTTPSPEYRRGNTPVYSLVFSRRWPLRLRFFRKQMISWFSVLSTLFLSGWD